MTEFIPCPFCGDKPSAEYIYGDLHYSCSNCFQGTWIREDIWNTRYSDQLNKELIDIEVYATNILNRSKKIREMMKGEGND